MSPPPITIDPVHPADRPDVLRLLAQQRSEHDVERTAPRHWTAYARAEADGCVAMDLEVEASHARVVQFYLREGFEAHTRSRFVRALSPREKQS